MNEGRSDDYRAGWWIGYDEGYEDGMKAAHSDMVWWEMTMFAVGGGVIGAVILTIMLWLS